MNKLMDNHNYISIELDLNEISMMKRRRKTLIRNQLDLFYFIKFFKRFIKINKSDNKSKYFFCKSSYMTDHKTTFKSH